MPLALAAMGCMSSPFYVDERFTPEEEQAIQAAADSWAEATNGKARVDLVYRQRVDLLDTNRRVIVKSPARAAENVYPLFREGDPGGHHLAWDAEVIVVVPERLDGIDLKYVITHELGHHFGIHHIADERAIMHPRPNPLSMHCLTADDLTAYCDTNGCDTTSMRPCGGGGVLGEGEAGKVK